MSRTQNAIMSNQDNSLRAHGREAALNNAMGKQEVAKARPQVIRAETIDHQCNTLLVEEANRAYSRTACGHL